MAKYCPTCGQVFPDTAQFCDADGTVLGSPAPVAAGGGRGWKKKLLIAGLTLVVLALAIALVLPGQMEGYIRKHVHVTIVGVELPPAPEGQQVPAWVGESALEKELARRAGQMVAAIDQGFTVRVKVDNDMFFGARLDAASYQLRITTLAVATGQWPESPDLAPLRIGSGESKELALKLRVQSPKDLWAMLLNEKGAGFPLRVKGEVTAGALGVTRTVPIDIDLSNSLPKVDFGIRVTSDGQPGGGGATGGIAGEIEREVQNARKRAMEIGAQVGGGGGSVRVEVKGGDRKKNAEGKKSDASKKKKAADAEVTEEK